MIDSEHLAHRLREFAQAREWDQFHTPRNLAAALSVEASELLELFQWSRGEVWPDLNGVALRPKVEEELADILLYLVRFADLAGVDLQQAAERKLALNAQKYPVATSKGSDRKYNE